MRTFRFSARFGFKIVPEIYQAFDHPELLNNLKTKISRERIGVELRSMLSNDNVFDCFTNFHKKGLWSIIFELPPGSNKIEKLNFK